MLSTRSAVFVRNQFYLYSSGLYPAQAVAWRGVLDACAPADAHSFGVAVFLATCVATFSCLHNFSLAAAITCAHVILVGATLAIATGDVVVHAVLQS